MTVSCTTATEIRTPAAPQAHRSLQSTRHHSKKKPWTDTNSDAACLRDNAGFFAQALYTTNIHTALSMLNPRERTACYVVAGTLLAVSVTCTAVFCKGLADGFGAAGGV